MFAGIDPGLAKTGVVILNAAAELVDSVLLTSKPSYTWEQRTFRIWSLSRVLENHLPWPCECAVLEGYSHSSGYRAHHMGELGHAYRSKLLNFYGAGVVFVVPPTTVKKFITGSGRATKEEVLESVARRFGHKFEDTNLSDACAMALFSLALKSPTMFKECELEVVRRWVATTSSIQTSTKES